MKNQMIVVLMVSFLAAPVLAEKPEWAGEGKPVTVELQKDARHATMQPKDEYDDENNGETVKKEKAKKEKQQKKKKSRLEKPADNKFEQELGKGSEAGQKAKAKEERKKWRKFLAALGSWLQIGR